MPNRGAGTTDTLEALWARPPVADITTGVNEACSTSLIRCL